jgi:ACR3 family arsenite transporter
MATEQNVNMEQKGPDLQQPIEDPPAAETVAQDPPVQEEPSKPETEAPRPTDNTDEIDERVLSRMSWVDRFLSVWILLAVGIGIALSYIPGLSKFFNETTAVGSTNILLAIGLIVMMYPPLAKVDYSTLPSLVRQPRYFFLSLILNWIVGPILMVVLALLIMGKTQVEYIEGLVLIGIARCIAMVLVWNELSGGDNNLCAMLVAMNSILQIALYAVYATLFSNVLLPALGFTKGDIDATRVSLGETFVTTLITVLIYLGIPFVMGLLSWIFLRKYMGDDAYYNKYCKRIGPVTLIALLFTIIVMFTMQGVTIIRTPLVVLWVACPLLLYFFLMFCGTFLLSWRLGSNYRECSTMAFTAAGNNFELALAVSISVYTPESRQAFSCIIGPLVEIPVMLALVNMAFLFRHHLNFTRYRVADITGLQNVKSNSEMNNV